MLMKSICKRETNLHDWTFVHRNSLSLVQIPPCYINISQFTFVSFHVVNLLFSIRTSNHSLSVNAFLKICFMWLSLSKPFYLNSHIVLLWKITCLFIIKSLKDSLYKKLALVLNPNGPPVSVTLNLTLTHTWYLYEFCFWSKNLHSGTTFFCKQSGVDPGYVKKKGGGGEIQKGGRVADITRK